MFSNSSPKTRFFPSIRSSSRGYLQWLTQVNPIPATIWSGWLNIRVVLSRHRLTCLYLLNTLFNPMWAPLVHTLHLICIVVLKSEIWMGETFGHWMGYENAGGAVWLGTKQDLVVRHTMLTLRHTANFGTFYLLSTNWQTWHHMSSVHTVQLTPGHC